LYTLVLDAISTYRCSRVLAGKGVAHQVFDQLARLVSLSNTPHPFVAVVVRIGGAPRSLVVHLLIFVVLDGLIA
jgi:hypothetical protein